MHRKWAFRMGVDYIPCLGLGGFVHGVSGEVSVVAWQMSSLISSGADPLETGTFFNGLTNADFADFMAKHGFHSGLKEGEVAFIPPGWHVSWLCVSDWATVLWQPWPHRSLLERLDGKVSEKVTKSLVDFCDRKGSEPAFEKDCSALSTWLLA